MKNKSKAHNLCKEQQKEGIHLHFSFDMLKRIK